MSSIGEAHRETSGRQGYVHYLGRCIRVKTYQIVHFKYLRFIICQLHFNKDVKISQKKNVKDIFLVSRHSYFQWTFLSFL